MNPVTPLWPEDERGLLGGQHEVDRDQNDPGARGRECKYGVLPAVVCQEGHPIPRRKAVVLQSGCRPVDQVLELGEGQGDVAVDDRHLVRLLTCRPARDVTERVAAREADRRQGFGLMHVPDCGTAVKSRPSSVPLSRHTPRRTVEPLTYSAAGARRINDDRGISDGGNTDELRANLRLADAGVLVAVLAQLTGDPSWWIGSRPRSRLCPTRRNRPVSPIRETAEALVDAVVAALGAARAGRCRPRRRR